MSDPRPIHVLAGLLLPTATSSLAIVTLTTSSLASLASLNVVGAAVLNTSLVVTGPVTGTSFSGVGTSLTALNAANLNSGVIPLARFTTIGTAGTDTFFRGDASWQKAVTAVTVVNSNGVSASVNNQGTTPQLTFTLSAITPTSVTASGVIQGVVFIPTGTSTPTLGVYAGSLGTGVSIATGSTERISVTAGGQIQVKGPIVHSIIIPAASAINCSLGNYFQKTVTGALTWTFTNVPTGVYYWFRLRLINGGKGTQTWPNTVKWPNTGLLGIANVPAFQNTGTDILEFVTDDGGASWRGYSLTTTTT